VSKFRELKKDIIKKVDDIRLRQVLLEMVDTMRYVYNAIPEG
jgi:hypothetical protein